MADVHDPKTRSYNMSKIQAKNTKPEMIVRKFLHANGLRYRLHVKDLPGKPDLVLLKYNTVVFVHGCFWHAHEGCKYFKLPSSNIEYWKPKLFGNRKRDEKHRKNLLKMGWYVETVWECKLKPEVFQNTLTGLKEKLENRI